MSHVINRKKKKNYSATQLTQINKNSLPSAALIVDLSSGPISVPTQPSLLEAWYVVYCLRAALEVFTKVIIQTVNQRGVSPRANNLLNIHVRRVVWLYRIWELLHMHCMLYATDERSKVSALDQ